MNSTRSIFYWIVLSSFGIAIFAANWLFPEISDDYCHLLNSMKLGGVEAVINTYFRWTPRTGELLLLLSGDILVGAVFDVINTFVFVLILYFTHHILLGKSVSGSRDGYLLISVFTFLSLSTAFASNFLWRAGALNYAWSMTLILGHFVVYRYYYADITSRYDKASNWLVPPFLLLSFLAGMSSFDLGALGCLIHIAFLTYRRLLKRTEEVKYLLPAIFYIAGFLVLFLAPGTKIRANSIENYVSISMLVQWVLDMEIATFTNHYLDSLGQVMPKTNYLAVFASLGVLWVIGKFQYRFKFIPWKAPALIGLYFLLLLVLVGILNLGDSKPTGNALGACILFANFVYSIIAMFYANKNHFENRQIFIFYMIFHCLLIIDSSSFAVGISPARRAYLGPGFITAALLSLQTYHFAFKKAFSIFVVPLLLLSMTLLTVHTYGYYKTNKVLISEPVKLITDSQEMLVVKDDYAILRAPKFQDWEEFSTNKKHWANLCFAKYHRIGGIYLENDLKRLHLLRYLRYLKELD